MRTSALRSSLSSFPYILRQTLSKLKYKQILTVESNRNPFLYSYTELHLKSGREEDLSSLVAPVPVIHVNNGDSNVGQELAKEINKDDILKNINQFYKEPEVKSAAEKIGLNSKLFHQAAISFRNFCMETEILPTELHIVLSDIIQKAGHVHDILPYFLKHAKENFPHLTCKKELKLISDLRHPANWSDFEQARKIKRKLKFHAGPTNSGKTYKALESFMKSKSGVYCSPLKLLSRQIFKTTNDKGIPCDLVTGEEREHGLPDNTPADHVACTIEMVSIENKYDVAVIDEIQMLKDPVRGGAWTRALLGLVADEIHICGEEAAIDLVKEIASSCGEEVEVIKYTRLTKDLAFDDPLQDLNNVQPGDCIVCFNKQDIFRVSLELEKRGFECAVIYGGLPPGTKEAQAKKFNDPLHSCKILVATDAIGMGLNLSIKRVIFYSIKKTVMNEEGEMEMKTISTSQALQIGGRAGRHKTMFPDGFVTTFRPEDLSILKDIMSKNVPKLEKAGLCPTPDQVGLFALELPKAPMSNLIGIFECLCEMDKSSYFLCNQEGFKFLADKIEHIPLTPQARYYFCRAPVDRKRRFVLTMFVKFAKQYAENDPITIEKLCQSINWPFSAPKNFGELEDLEAVFDVLELYLWLSHRFPYHFPHVKAVKGIQKELDEIIDQGVSHVTHLKIFKATDGSEGQVEDIVLSKLNNYVPSVSCDSIEMAKRFEEPSHVKSSNDSLTQKLLSQGTLTLEMLRILHKEWKALEKSDSSFDPFAIVDSQGFYKMKKKRSKRSM